MNVTSNVPFKLLYHMERPKHSKCEVNVQPVQYCKGWPWRARRTARWSRTTRHFRFQSLKVDVVDVGLELSRLKRNIEVTATSIILDYNASTVFVGRRMDTRTVCGPKIAPDALIAVCGIASIDVGVPLLSVTMLSI